MKIFLAGTASRLWIIDYYANLSRQSSYVSELQRWSTIGTHSDGGGIPNNEDISGREYNLSKIYRSDAIRGGFSLIQNENISCGCDTVWREEKYRGGL